VKSGTRLKESAKDVDRQKDALTEMQRFQREERESLEQWLG